MTHTEEKRDIAAEIEAKAAALNLTADWVFVPLSASRNRDEKNPTINWRYKLKRNGCGILEGDYSQGCAHAPAYNLKVTHPSGRPDEWQKMRGVRAECETGKVHRFFGHGWGPVSRSLPPPRLADLLWSLSLDASVLDCSGFENWAGELGYDTDSRKAEAIYRACLESSLKLRAAIGNDELEALREVARDY